MILVGDVGGTHTRLACAQLGRQGWRLDGLRERLQARRAPATAAKAY